MNQQMFLLYGPKLLIIAANYILVNICANYTSQVYMDKVLINQENPPKLENFVMMFMLLNLLTILMISIGFYVALPYIGGGGDKSGHLLQLLVVDFLLYIALVLVTSAIIADVMYNKKFFMYKDDGLRAIRALKDIMLKLSTVFAVLPYFLVIKK